MDRGTPSHHAPAPELLTWQLVDSAFPTGGFAHSWGLEAAWQFGELRSAGDVQQFVRASVRQAGRALLPFLTHAYRDPASLADLDARAETFLTNAVANRASRVQGRALVSTSARVWPTAPLLAAKRELDAVRGHVGPASGVVFRALGLPLATAQRLTLFAIARGGFSAAVRLGAIGSYEAQQLQSATADVIEQTATSCTALSVDDVAQTEPLLDLLQAQHDRLYSRLFQS
jgi:urease accessory protein